MPQIWERANQKKYQDFSPEIETAGYPSYYLQTSITRRMATLVIYQPISMTCRLTFSLVAQPMMRRRILVRRGLKALIRLHQGKYGFSMWLVELVVPWNCSVVLLWHISVWYRFITCLLKANQLLSQIRAATLHANAEEPPYLDNHFHAVTCVFSSMSYRVQCVSR